MKRKDRNYYCKGRTKDGKSCGAAATAGGLCFFHANPNRAAELGRIGGRKNRHAVDPNTDPLPKLNTLADVREMGHRLFSDLYTGKVDPRTAGALASILNLQARAIAANYEERLARLEKWIENAQREAKEFSKTELESVQQTPRQEEPPHSPAEPKNFPTLDQRALLDELPFDPDAPFDEPGTDHTRFPADFGRRAAEPEKRAGDRDGGKADAKSRAFEAGAV